VKPERQAYLLLALIILLWGANWPIMKIGLEYIPPVWFTAIRLLFGAACLFVLLAVRGKLILPVRHDLPALLSMGFVQFGLGLALIHIGLSSVEAGRSAILAYTTPLWVAPMAVLILGERLGPYKIAGLILGLAGLAVLFNPATFDFSNPDVLLGNGLLLAAAICFSAVIVHIRRHRLAMTPLQLVPWQMLLGGCVLMAVAAVYEEMPPLAYSHTLAAVIIYNGPIASAYCFWASFTIMRTLSATSTALGSLGVPVAGLVFSAIALGEPLSAPKVLGLTLISSAVVALIVGDFIKKPKLASQWRNPHS